MTTQEELEKHKLGTDLSKQIARRWKAGDIYAPHDLSPTEIRKWKQRGRPEVDAFDLLDMNPIDEYKVSLVINGHGGILTSEELFDHVGIYDAYGPNSALE